MEEQEIYQNVLKKLIDQTERLQINNSEELIQRLINELKYYELPRMR
ncbi:hypothetical protein [Aquibacillus salsiterrae]|uniref:Uncharacterized protein n=1 Tax=Aquibacillus salsiterrae TaxID=2950439 RepID=A0A9X3WCY2_9BACI|nr:hypothetical protein [Aquibacillus salsiterrae]MDC3416106.1 hypothetical protein [Aquibacillus salsiterrae]